MNTERLEYLFKRYYDKTCTPGEKNELMDNISEAENDPVLNKLIDEVLHKTQGELELDNNTAAAILQSIVQADKKQLPAIVRPMKRVFIRAAAAAVILFLLSAGVYFYFNMHEQKQIANTGNPSHMLKNDVSPGGNKAILTLANGAQIVLDSTVNGTITQQGNTKILKLNDGHVAYEPVAANGEVLYNTISTPRGGQYQVELADGSKVWLNSASSLRFPASFTGKERNVALTGEGYFEVAHNAVMPFRVTVNGMTVEVLGTHFNINAYEDEESMRTTLLEGSVKISVGSAEKNAILTPGQQAQVSQDNSITVQLADIDKTMAWRNGWFEFDQTDLATIMRQVSRWYDVDIQYEGKPGSRKFGGRFSKALPLSSILYMLEGSGVEYTLEGKKLVIKESK